MDCTSITFSQSESTVEIRRCIDLVNKLAQKPSLRMPPSGFFPLAADTVLTVQYARQFVMVGLISEFIALQQGHICDLVGPRSSEPASVAELASPPYPLDFPPHLLLLPAALALHPFRLPQFQTCTGASALTEVFSTALSRRTPFPPPHRPLLRLPPHHARLGFHCRIT